MKWKEMYPKFRERVTTDVISRTSISLQNKYIFPQSHEIIPLCKEEPEHKDVEI
jgi:hypothetical protein